MACLLVAASVFVMAGTAAAGSTCHGQTSVRCTYEECEGSGDEKVCKEHDCTVWVRGVTDYACLVGSVGA